MTMLADILWQPFFAPVAILGGAAVVAMLCIWSYLRSAAGRAGLALSLMFMRLALIALIAVILMGPSRLPDLDQQAARSTLYVMVDTSASMQTPDMDGQPRLGFAIQHWLSGKTFDALSREHEIRLIAYDDSARPAAVEALRGEISEIAVGSRTSLAGSLRSMLASVSHGGDGSAILVLGDGRETDAQPMSAVGAMARAHSLPIYTATVGGPQFGRDIAITAAPQQEYLLAGEEGHIQVSILQNSSERAATTLTIQCGDDVEQHAIELADAQSAVIEIPVRQSEPGLYEYILEVTALPEEVEHRNNTTRVFLEVTAARFRILLIEGEPYWDTKYLAQSLRKDDRVELTQITHLTPDRQSKVVTRADAESARLPTSLDELAAYDVVILGRGLERLITSEIASLLPPYVAERGGRVIFARGQAYDPTTPAGRDIGRMLAPIEPVVWGRGRLHEQRMVVSDLGRAHPSFTGLLRQDGAPAGKLALLPELLSVPVVQREKVGAQVLAISQAPGAAPSAAGQPALLAMPYDRGMVVALVGEGLWRWTLQARRQPELEGVFDAFWSNMIRWLVMDSQFTPGRNLSLRLSNRSLQLGHEVRFDVTARASRQDDIPARVVVIDPDGGEHPINLAARSNSTLRFDGDYQPTTAGVYTVRLESTDEDEPPVETRFFAYDVNLERLQSAANPQAMRELAQASGGAVLDPLRPEAFDEILARHRAATVVPPQPRFAWDRMWIMVGLIGWAGAEWLVRKRGGLV